MPLRTRLVIQVSGVKEAQVYLRQINKVIPDIMKEVKNEIEPFILEDIQAVPGPVVYPIEWTPSRHSEDQAKAPNTSFGYYSRQKAAYYQTNGFGRGIPTKRTGEHAENWRLVIRVQGQGRFDFVLENTLAETKYIVGSFNRRTGLQVQQRFHKNTGWPAIQQKAPAYVNLFLEKFAAKFNKSFVSAFASFEATTRNR